MHSLQLYSQPDLEYDNKAYTISSIYHGGHLKMYTSHPIPPRTPEGKPGFIITRMKTWGLTGDTNTLGLSVDDQASGEDTIATSQETVLNLGLHISRSLGLIRPPMNYHLIWGVGSPLSVLKEASYQVSIN